MKESIGPSTCTCVRHSIRDCMQGLYPRGITGSQVRVFCEIFITIVTVSLWQLLRQTSVKKSRTYNIRCFLVAVAVTYLPFCVFHDRMQHILPIYTWTEIGSYILKCLASVLLSTLRSQRALTLYPVTDCAAATDISGVSGRWHLSR